MNREQLAAVQDAYRRALARAARERLVAYKLDAGVYGVPSASEPGTLHTVRRTGTAWHAWSCDCTAGTFGRVCAHKATALFAARHGVHATRRLRIVKQAAA